MSTTQEALRPRSFTLSGGMVLRADEAGPADGQPIVFLHGGGQTRASWGGAVREMGSRGYYAVTVDQRGHGQSDRGPTYVMEAYVRDLGEIVQQLGRKPVLVGASLGGLASMILAGENPGTVEALILVDITPKVNEGGAGKIRGFMDAYPDGFSALEEAADAISEYLTHRPRPKKLDGLRKNLVQGEDGRWRWHWDAKFINGEPGVGFHRDEARAEAALARVDAPTLLVRGAQSELLTDDVMADFRRTKPDATVVSLEGARHMVAGDSNDVFVATVTDFLDGLRPAM